MTTQSNLARAIFLEAIEEKGPEHRSEFVMRACGGDADLRARVERLLKSHELLGSFHDDVPPALVTIDQPIQEKPGTHIGPYKLLQVIGEGGMGVVYMAEQKEPVERQVALKIIKPGMDSRQVIARFEAERQALALMDHPNIAKVLDAGTTGERRDVSPPVDRRADAAPLAGRPFFVMELVKGVPITQYCDEHHLTLKQRLELFVPVCQAIQHAHQKGIIHRDLKPTNVLVAEYDNQPVPKVIDFGVAKATAQKLTEKTIFTEFGQVVGTLEYMSPEQAKLNQLDIDTRGDIYSLGVLLYELLTGTTPFDRKRLHSAAFDEMLRIIREEEPPKPSNKLSSSDTLPSIAANRSVEPARLSRQVKGELDWIVMKCLEKDRNRRYETANAFAADLQHFLHDEPVQACPPSAGYRLGKFARRNRRALTTAAVVILAVVLGIGSLVGSIGWILGDRAAQREAKGREADFALKQTAQLLAEGNAAQASAWARRVEVVLTGEEPPIGLKQRLEEVHADLEMVDKLEEIRIRKSEVKDEHYDFAQADPAYAQAFRDYGLDVEKLGSQDAAERVGARNIRMDLVLALDDWADVVRWIVKADDRRWKHLLAVARAADPDERRNQLRAAWEQEPMDRQALEQVAASDKLSDLPAPTLFLLSGCLRRSGSAETAVAVLRQAQWKYPHDFWVNHHLAFQLMEMRPPRWQEAIPFYTAAVALRPESPGARINLSVALAYKGDQEWRIAVLKGASHLKVDYASAYLNLGNALLAKELHQDAIVALREAIRLKPDLVYAHNNLGLALKATGKVDEAIDCFHKAIALDPVLPGPHLHLAHALLILKEDRAGAINAAKEGLRHQPRYSMEALPCYGLARRLVANADVEEEEAELAVELAQRAVTLYPNRGYYWTMLGMAHYRAGHWDDAITALEKANSLFAGGGSFEWFFLTMARWQRGDKDQAQRAFARAVQWADSHKAWFEADQERSEKLRLHRAEAEKLLGPENVQAALNRPVAILDQARQHVLARRWTDAAPLYEESQQWYADDHAIWFERAAVLLLSGDMESFRQLREAYLKLPVPGGIGTQLYFHVRLASFAPVERDEAQQMVELAERSLAVKAWMLNTNNAGYAYYRAGKFDVAIDHFQQSLHDWGEQAGRVINWPGLALAHHRLGHAEEARQWLDQAADFAKENPDGAVMHIHHWLVFHVWLREAERVIGQVDRQPSQ